ncbi:hypothetical protein BO71DRAFT_352744 [Aspergillus ellipticus CBS 707.79]|uniref:Uncharacterized protein n=1 Tax=Aspergillus ellipticus CBS 707.79 TaxID=1448320 RepID=A0A319E2M3_9EURO|nr:hypothetical protein BO71DRAFT_352744 [Aspergillus ellipticus CBS 707.79]
MIIPCICEQGFFAMSSDSIEQKQCTYCNHTVSEHDDVETPSGCPPSALHLEEFEEPGIDKVTQSPLTCLREDTISAFAEVVKANPVVHVRGTPSSGKTTLAYLLSDHLLENGWKVFFLKTWGLQLRSYCTGDETAWDGLKRKLHQKYPGCNPRDIFAPKTVLLVDEAQGSYSDEMFWNQVVKERMDGFLHEGFHICFFCSYGSPYTCVEAQFYTPATFHPEQRITLTPQPTSDSPGIGLFFNQTEFEDAVARRIRHFTEYFTLHREAKEYLFALTNGHPGAVDGVLSYIYKVYRSQIKHGKLSEITKELVIYSLNDEAKVWTHLSGRAIARSFPRGSALTPEAATVLADISETGSIPWDNRPGMQVCFTQGWIHKVIARENSLPLEKELAVLPSRLHEKWVERHIGDEQTPLPGKYSTLRKLCLEVLSQFSVMSLRHSSQGKKMSSAARFRSVEAQYQDEFYKAFKTVAGRGVPICSEWSRTKQGRLDFWIPEKMWAIELLRDSSRIDEHVSRFKNTGQYHGWLVEGMIKEWIVVNCATTLPASDCSDPNLIHAIFQEDYKVLHVYDHQRRSLGVTRLQN